MRNGNKPINSDVQKIDNGVDRRLFGSMTDIMSFHRFGFVWLVVMGAALLFTAGSAFGQYGSFTVTPMRLNLQVTPGSEVNTVVNIQNLDPNETYTVDLSVVELTQSPDGEWMIVDPNSVADPNSPSYGFDLNRLSSCSRWVRLAYEAVTLEPSQMVPTQVNIRVRRGAHGFHTAGILASVQHRPGLGRLPISVRFLVPVVVEIETRPQRPRIKATDVGMRFRPAGGEGPATTFVSMGIQNDGGTLSELKPIARIYAYSKEHWHLVTTTEFENKRIIPGAILNLQTDIGKSLPTGRYRIRGELYVDGRRTKPVEKIIDFEGDPTINAVKADAPLDIKPLDLTIDCSPGSLRSGTITVYNASDEVVNIQTATGLQSHLQQLVGDNVKGVDLDCTSWIKISPQNFTLPGGGGRQNVQIVAKLPTGAMHPCYYSLLALWATYPDGQKAGFKTANIFLKNNEIAFEPMAQGLNIRLQELDESKFLITSQFRNLKKIHFKPLSVRAGVIPTSGEGALSVPRLSTYLYGDPSPMLPFETRTFSGDMDFSDLPAGRYILTGRLEYAPGQVVRPQSLIDISIQGERRLVQIIGTPIELRGAVQVDW